MENNTWAYLKLQQKAALLKASSANATFALPPANNLRHILQTQYDDWARRSTQALVETAALGDTYAEPDLRIEREFRLEQQLRDAGIEPWPIPRPED